MILGCGKWVKCESSMIHCRTLIADKPSGAAKAQKGSLGSVVQLQWWMSPFGTGEESPTDRNHIATHHNMKVLRVNLIGMLLSIKFLGCEAFRRCFNRVCMEDKMNHLAWPMPMPMSNEGMINDPILEPKHKIFLSHSGAQKEFVDHLRKALEDQFYYPFFDRRPENVSKGEQFSELIIQAVGQCEMLIVVVSDEYFMSKWPMIELSAFVQAYKLHHESKGSTKGPKILPLFYGLSVGDLDDATMQMKWFKKWETLAKADSRKQIIVSDWKYAFDALKSFNGFPYDKNLKDIMAYEEKIVLYVRESVSLGMGTNPILEPKHKIFLSHSGAQKEFVHRLCKALEDRFHYPFFDRHPESLPKGKQFPKLIVRAVEQCEMLIVVVSDEYFMSKWPMIELSAFVEAHKLHHESKGSTKGPKILPLFYGLSMDDLEDATMQMKWFQKWETLAKADPKKRIIVSDWKYAFDVLKSFDGLPYDKNLKEIVAYEEEIVSHVCKSIPPNMRWDDSHVQGKSYILKVTGEMIEGTGVSRQYKAKVVGIYGVGGIGKTTVCKTLCNEFSIKYEGRVCHIEFPIVPLSVSKEFFQKVFWDLTRKSMDSLQHLDVRQCKTILRDCPFKQRTFLAIDNVSDNKETMELANLLLELPYHPDSLVVVTARSLSALALLGLDAYACFEMPNLEKEDAMRLFLHHAVGGKEFFKDEEKRDIMTCIKRCYFSNNGGFVHHYHPLALEALGLQLGLYGSNPSTWVKNLPPLNTFNDLSKEHPIFGILRSRFDSLRPKDQTLFMDVGRILIQNDHSADFVIEWLCIAHKQDKEEIFQRLEELKQKGLLLDVDLRSRRISMHDLYLECFKLEAQGSLSNSQEILKKKLLDVDYDDLPELESGIRRRGVGFFE